MTSCHEAAYQQVRVPKIMKTEYWENKFVTLLYAVNALLFLGISLAIIIQGKSDKFPIIITIFMFALGMLFLSGTIKNLKHPAYRIDGNKLYIRRLFRKETCIQPNDSWKVSGDKDQIILSKDKQLFMISKFNLGKSQFKDLIEKLGIIADENSNQSLHKNK
jgi:hypothetical protein